MTSLSGSLLAENPDHHVAEEVVRDYTVTVTAEVFALPFNAMHKFRSKVFCRDIYHLTGIPYRVDRWKTFLGSFNLTQDKQVSWLTDHRLTRLLIL